MKLYTSFLAVTCTVVAKCQFAAVGPGFHAAYCHLVEETRDSSSTDYACSSSYNLITKG